MKWSNKTIFDFLTLYKSEPALWDTRVAEHKNRKDQYDAWLRLQSNLKDGNFPIKELKKKRDALMATYRKLNSKIRKSVNAGCSAGELYRPDWPFYSIMAVFLDDVYNPRKRKKCNNFQTKEEIQDYNDDEDDECAGNDDTTQNDVDRKKSCKMRKTFHKTATEDEMERRIFEAYDYLKQMTEKFQTPQDECALYSRLLCKKLRGLPEKMREIAMLEIDRLIFNLKQNESASFESFAEVSSLKSYVPQTFHFGQTQFPYAQDSTSKCRAYSPQPSSSYSATLPHRKVKCSASPSPQPSSSNQSSPSS